MILAVAGDPGAAEALAPVLERLAGDERLEVQAYAYRAAATLWANAGCAWTALPEENVEDALERLSSRADLLLAGNSAPNAFDWEKRLIVRFRELRRPSLVIVDYWSNYARRFSTREAALACVPDCVAAIDDAARAGLIAAGIAPERIEITGHPGFDSLVAGGASGTARAAVRRTLGVAEDERLVLFASHPAQPGSDAHAERHAALEGLYDALARAAARLGTRAALVVRPHPKELELPAAAPRAGPGVRLFTSAAAAAREVVLAADAVAGVETMLLVEAYHMQRPTVSIRPAGHAGELPVPVPVATDAAALERFLTQALRHGPQAGDAPRAAPGGATERVVSLIHRMLGRASTGGVPH